MTPSRLDDSANAPWTRRIVGFAQADADALEICFLDRWDFGFAVTVCHTPGIVNNTEQWVQIKISASGLRNGG
jgi:hypothetical protein